MPAHPDAWLGVARNLYALGYEQEAYQELQRVLERHPDLIEAHLLRKRWELGDGAKRGTSSWADGYRAD
jgi:TolA-binding protein